MNPYTKPGSVKVKDYFKDKDTEMPLFPGSVFKTIEEMLSTFDKPELLEIGESYGVKFLKLKNEN